MLALRTNAKVARRVEHSVASWHSSISPNRLGPKREQPKDAIASSLASLLELGPPARCTLLPREGIEPYQAAPEMISD